jgi:hypothetical protein
MPGAAFAGRSTEMVGFHEAVLRPVLAPFTTGETPAWTFRENVSWANTRFFSEFPVTYTDTYVATVHLFDTAGNGAPFSLHVVSHATLTGNGTITVSFSDLRLDCGA